jgi:hypothetical protein
MMDVLNKLFLLWCISLIGFPLTSLAQTNFGPNAGSIQQQMMYPGGNRYGRMPDMFYGPVTAQEMGLPPKGYENPVVLKDGVVNGRVINPNAVMQNKLPPLSP